MTNEKYRHLRRLTRKRLQLQGFTSGEAAELAKQYKPGPLDCFMDNGNSQMSKRLRFDRACAWLFQKHFMNANSSLFTAEVTGLDKEAHELIYQAARYAHWQHLATRVVWG